MPPTAVTWLVLGLLPRKMRQSCRASSARPPALSLGTLLISPTRITRWSVNHRAWSGAAAWATNLHRLHRVKAAAALRSKGGARDLSGPAQFHDLLCPFSLAIYALVGHSVVEQKGEVHCCLFRLVPAAISLPPAANISLDPWGLHCGRPYFLSRSTCSVPKSWPPVSPARCISSCLEAFYGTPLGVGRERMQTIRARW